MNDKLYAQRKFEIETPEGDVFIAVAELKSLSGQDPYFSICGELYDRGPARGEASVVNSKGQRKYLGACGQMTDDVIKHFYELHKFLKWHLTSTVEPMHYVANTVYHASKGNVDAARRSAVWLDAPLETLMAGEEHLTALLLIRLPALMDEFRRDMAELFGSQWNKGLTTDAKTGKVQE